ncbi:MAG: chorismate mutase [Candidatus Delongbacteria bacterium]|nr:chorismate mutase [Candidatus Delongbacteria bacterium]
MMTLSDIRGRIDSLDERITGLLKERLFLALKAGELKTGIEDKDRESDILSRIASNCVNADQIQFLTEIYGQIFSSGKIIMSNHKKKND